VTLTRRLILGSVAVGLATSAFTGTASAANPTAVPGAIGVRLLDVPASAAADPRAHLYIVDSVAPGKTIERHIEVSNTTSSVAHVALYQGAATIVDGSFIGGEGHSANALTSWTSVSPATADLPAGRATTATVTITVPDDAVAGEQYGVIWAEVRSASDATVTQVNRVGIRIYLSVGSGAAAAADFSIDSLIAKRSASGAPVIVANVHNTGGRALDMSGILQLLGGPGGLSAGPFLANLGVTLGIGDTEPVTITLDRRIPAGPWDARITLHSGLLERTATATITFPDTGAAAAVVPTNARHPGRTPAALAVGAGLLLALLLSIALLLRRRRRRAPKTPRRSHEGRHLSLT
jgi:hypothetical protein